MIFFKTNHNNLFCKQWLVPAVCKGRIQSGGNTTSHGDVVRWHPAPVVWGDADAAFWVSAGCMMHIPYILYPRQQATQSRCWSTTMWKGSSTRRTTVRRVGGSAGYISHTIRRQKKVTHFQDAGKRPEKPGEENPWLGFWPELGERNSDDGQPRLRCNQTSGMSTATVISFSFKLFVFSQQDFCHTHSSWCLLQMFMRSYYVQLFGTFTFLFLATLALFSKKYSAARPEGRINQVALEYPFHYLWFWKDTCICFFKSKMFKPKKMKILSSKDESWICWAMVDPNTTNFAPPMSPTVLIFHWQGWQE